MQSSNIALNLVGLGLGQLVGLGTTHLVGSGLGQLVGLDTTCLVVLGFGQFLGFRHNMFGRSRVWAIPWV